LIIAHQQLKIVDFAISCNKFYFWAAAVFQRWLRRLNRKIKIKKNVQKNPNLKTLKTLKTKEEIPNE